ncbi:MAG: hypothetical protein H7257_07375 [Taibaiella sp.]|nr:hypothetical protein [Taibaiella sp.]
MKKILLYKRADIALQLLAVSIPIVTGCLVNQASVFFSIYGSLGLVQIISCVVNHLYLPAQFRHQQRHRYNLCLIIITIIVIALWLAVLLGNDYTYTHFVGGLIIFTCFAMVVIGFVLAFWYFVITITETQYIGEQVKSGC